MCLCVNHIAMDQLRADSLRKFRSLLALIHIQQSTQYNLVKLAFPQGMIYNLSPQLIINQPVPGCKIAQPYFFIIVMHQRTGNLIKQPY